MAEQTKVKTLEKVVIRFSGDSGDGMQLTGTTVSYTHLDVYKRQTIFAEKWLMDDCIELIYKFHHRIYICLRGKIT